MPLPILLNLRNTPILVVGLGRVGRWRAARFAEAGARVTAVDLFVDVAPKGVALRHEPYRLEHLDGQRLVLAAATPEVNRAVVDDAKARGIWVNSASDPEASDFVLPATWTDGPLTLAVSAGGNPALARTLRDRAAASLGPEAAALAAILARLRPLVLARIHDPGARHTLFRSWAEPRWLDHVRDHGPEATEAALRAQLP